MVERIERLGYPSFYGYLKYIQIVKKAKITSEKNRVDILIPVEFPSNEKTKVDILA